MGNLRLNSSSGGYVEIAPPATGSNFTLTAPANNATLFTTAGGTINGGMTVTGNVAFTSNNVSIAGKNIAPSYGMKNRIINGDFRIDQRFGGTANNNITGISQYVVDRWLYVTNIAAGKQRFQQNNTNGPGSSATQNATGFPFYFGANTISANTINSSDFMGLQQIVEGQSISDLAWGTANASPVTLSFWVYTSVPGTHCVNIVNGLANRSYPATYTVNTANTWEQKTVTIPGDTTGTWFTNNNIGMYFSFGMGFGSSYAGTNNTWNAGNLYGVNGVVTIADKANGSFYLTGVQLEKGSVATPFEFRHYTTELQLCQRYYQKYADSYSLYTSWGSSGGYGMWSSMYLVTMRAAPTATFPVLSAGSVYVSNFATGSGYLATSGLSGASSTGFNLILSAELAINN